MKYEAKFGILFRHWLKANPMLSAAFELKQTKTDSLSFGAVKDHQIQALLAAQTKKGILYKIPDDSRGIKPFDYVYLSCESSFVVIRYPGCFVIIKVTEFEREKHLQMRKSLTLARAKKIAYKIINL